MCRQSTKLQRSMLTLSYSIKFNETFKVLPLGLYESIYTALGESLMANIALSFACAIFATWLSLWAV